MVQAAAVLALLKGEQAGSSSSDIERPTTAERAAALRCFKALKAAPVEPCIVDPGVKIDVTLLALAQVPRSPCVRRVAERPPCSLCRHRLARAHFLLRMCRHGIGANAQALATAQSRASLVCSNWPTHARRMCSDG